MGALTTWSPFRELERIARRWESPLPRLFEDMEDNHNEVFMPAVESYVKDGNLVVRADVPGLELKDLDVSVLRNVLTDQGRTQDGERGQKGGLPAPRGILRLL